MERDYAKWMLEDPRLNFAISTRASRPGIDHLGFQTDDPDELAALKARAESADLALLDEGETTCCYARSEKHWVTDPQGIAWEHFHTLGNIPVFSESRSPVTASACCSANEGAAGNDDRTIVVLHTCTARQADRRSRSRPRAPPAAEVIMEEKNYNVLFICTGNSARSIIAEGLMNQLGAGRFKAYSAGSHPKGAVHPLALHALEENGIDVTGFRSKSWDEFARPEAPELHFVFTVCDKAGGEVCPVWPGQPITAHWGMPDPGCR